MDSRSLSNSCSLSRRPRPGTSGLVPPCGGRGGGSIIATDLPRLALGAPLRDSEGGHLLVPSHPPGGGRWAVGRIRSRSPLQRRTRGTGHVLNRAHPRRSLVRGRIHHRQRRRKERAPSLQSNMLKRFKFKTKFSVWVCAQLYNRVHIWHQCPLK